MQVHLKDFCSQCDEQTFDVTLEELGQDAIRGQLVEHTAEELLRYTCYIPWDQHTAKISTEERLCWTCGHTSHLLLNPAISTGNSGTTILNVFIPLSLSREIGTRSQPERR